jgi:predicted transposase/invertase (TIGR01784 family)
VAARLDFATLEFLDKELFTDFPEGSVREADVVARVHTHEGVPEIILVHIEVQLRPRGVFAYRMYQYYALLKFKYGVPVFPVAVYLQGGKGLAAEQDREALFGEEQLRFRFKTVALAKLDAEEYVAKGNPVAAALAALMNRNHVADRLTLRALMMQYVVKRKLDGARERLLLNLIKTYFKLKPEEVESFHQVLSKPEYREVQEMELTWEEEVLEKGREQGRLSGLIEGKRETLKHQLTKKFGSLPENTVFRIEALDSLEELDTYLDRVLTAETLQDMGLDGR